MLFKNTAAHPTVAAIVREGKHNSVQIHTCRQFGGMLVQKPAQKVLILQVNIPSQERMWQR